MDKANTHKDEVEKLRVQLSSSSAGSVEAQSLETVAKSELDAIVAELAAANEEHAAAKAHAHDKNLGLREKLKKQKALVKELQDQLFDTPDTTTLERKVRSLEKQLKSNPAVSDATETEAQRKSRDLLEVKVRELEAKLKSQDTPSTTLEQELVAFKARCDKQTLALFDAALKYEGGVEFELSINAIPSQEVADQIEATIRGLNGKRLEMGQVKVGDVENRPPIGKASATDKTAGRQRQVRTILICSEPHNVVAVVEIQFCPKYRTHFNPL